MDRPQLIRRLRIAASVFFAVVTLALCVLWVRSYWNADSLTRIDNNLVLTRVGTGPGVFFFGSVYHATNTSAPDEITDGWEYQEYDSNPKRVERTWEFRRDPGSWAVIIPAWFVTLLLFSLSIAPWLKMRFSLRTLLIATTLVAVVLGLAIRSEFFAH